MTAAHCPQLTDTLISEYIMLVWLPRRGDLCTTVSHNKGAISRIDVTINGPVLVLRSKDTRTGEFREIRVSSSAIIRVKRGEGDFAILRTVKVIKQRPGFELVMLPMDTVYGEEEYAKYQRNKLPSLVQDWRAYRNETEFAGAI